MSIIEDTIDFEHFEKKIYNNFFHKKNSKTSHETLYTNNSILRSGYIKSEAEEGYYTHINYNTMKKALELLNVKYQTFGSDYLNLSRGELASFAGVATETCIRILSELGKSYKSKIILSV